MPDQYTQCHICGHTIPVGHPCLNCVKSNRIKETDEIIAPENLVEHIKILRLQKDDILVLKNIYVSEENDLSFLTELDVLKNKNITLVILPDPDSEFIIIRSNDDRK